MGTIFSPINISWPSYDRNSVSWDCSDHKPYTWVHNMIQKLQISNRCCKRTINLMPIGWKFKNTLLFIIFKSIKLQKLKNTFLWHKGEKTFFNKYQISKVKFLYRLSIQNGTYKASNTSVSQPLLHLHRKDAKICVLHWF